MSAVIIIEMAGINERNRRKERYVILFELSHALEGFTGKKGQQS